MVSDSLKHYKSEYKPSGKAWVAACVLFLSIVAIVALIMASDFTVDVKSAIEIKVQNGKDAVDVNVYNINQPRNFGA